ncbi:MAG: hypothetical protein WCS84_06875 [Nocardioides sp.]
MRDVDLTEEQVAEALGVTTRRCRQLVTEGALVRSRQGRYGAVASWRAWREHLEASRAEKAEDIKAAELRLARAKADAAEENLAILRGDHVPVAQAEAEVSRAASAVAQRLRSIPGSVARRLEGRPAGEIAKLLRESIARAMTILSSVRVALVTEDTPEVVDDDAE